MDASGELVTRLQIPACFTQRQPGTERSHSGGSEHVEWEMNAQVDTRPGDRDAQQSQSHAGDWWVSLQQETERNRPPQRQMVAGDDESAT